MDKLDFDLIYRIQKALNIELYNWQVNYILDIPMILDLSISGRGTGKTLAYVIKLLFCDKKPIRIYDINDIFALADEYHNPNRNRHCYNPYNRFFADYLFNIYRKLTDAGIKTRPVFINIGEYKEYKKNLYTR